MTSTLSTQNADHLQTRVMQASDHVQLAEPADVSLHDEPTVHHFPNGNFDYRPLEGTPPCVVNIRLAHESSETKTPSYIGSKNLRRASSRHIDQNRRVFGYPLDYELTYQRGRGAEGYALDKLGRANSTLRFMNILEKFCGLNLERDINMVNMANGMTALCVTVAQNQAHGICGARSNPGADNFGSESGSMFDHGAYIFGLPSTPRPIPNETKVAYAMRLQNLTPETMKVDKDKLEKLKRFLGATEEPRWYKFTWEFYHGADEDQIR
ncbi:uncharacterized protein STEHIDRAFT_159959 [Stereum hirsutum FP-91666 SS1]|uniref:uncharacterized protein n=1 Tax=Stereum hirsutum (strain FP-91666) TaxID=721885 RepID=UPI0004449F88|nr:uncharacterized protein STEHIDRAFT_159959 [Stereum hirsutum FP-91666 SS1]EIM83375.1 hypothetical protein STEHIDRAFT_159959 [Stereum hirsutum FP-91666 SS1]